MTWQQAVEKADCYKAIGQSEIYLDDDDEKPWEFLSGIEEGCTYCYGCSINVHCSAKHPCGLTFTWTTGLVDRRNNAGINPDSILCGELVAHATPTMAPVVRWILDSLAAKWKEWGDDAEANARRCRANSTVFASAAATLPR